MAIEADVRDALAKQELDAELAILLEGTQAESIRRHSVEEVALREMRPLVRRLVLRANQRDLAPEAGITKTGRHRIAGGPGADDYCSFGRSSFRRRRIDQYRKPPSTATANEYALM